MAPDLPSIDADSSGMRISAVCISRNQETWDLQSIPFYNYTEGWRPFEHEKTIERVAYLAERRNNAITKALSILPETKHVLMIDSYYLQQKEQVSKLIDEYSELTLTTYQTGCILGASTWIHDETRIRSKNRFYDYWTTPEGIRLKLDEVEKKGGMIEVKAVGGCYLYPRWVWERTRYGVSEDLHGCEHNWLCERSSIPVFLTLNERLWRKPATYQWSKRIRMSAHLGRLIGR